MRTCNDTANMDQSENRFFYCHVVLLHSHLNKKLPDMQTLLLGYRVPPLADCAFHSAAAEVQHEQVFLLAPAPLLPDRV